MPRTRTSSRSTGETVKHLGTLSLGVAANTADLPYLEGQGQELTGIVAEITSVLSERAIQTAAKQELARKLDGLVDRGEKLGTFIRAGVRQRYGRRSEKLVEFDMLPFRGRKSPVQEEKAEAVAETVQKQG